MQYEKLSKKALTCMYVKSVIQLVMVCAIIVLLEIAFHEEWPAYVNAILFGVMGFDLLYVLISPKIRYERYRYILTEEELQVRKGLIVVKTAIVPIERLHKIEVSSGPIFRAFGLEEVLATTAGGDISVSYLTKEAANEIAGYLKKRINTIAVEERNAGTEEAAGQYAGTEEKDETR